MRVRDFKPSDQGALYAMAEKSGFPYPHLDDGRLEAVCVVADEDDNPIMAVGAKRLVEMYFWCQRLEPFETLAALRLLHEQMGDKLKAKGYDSVEAFLPPSISEKFGRRLQKSFGWVRNWTSWNRRL